MRRGALGSGCPTRGRRRGHGEGASLSEGSPYESYGGTRGHNPAAVTGTAKLFWWASVLAVCSSNQRRSGIHGRAQELEQYAAAVRSGVVSDVLAYRPWLEGEGCCAALRYMVRWITRTHFPGDSPALFSYSHQKRTNSSGALNRISKLAGRRHSSVLR